MTTTAPATPPAADAPHARLCVDCDYDLRGLSTDRCPECGADNDPATASVIPWVRRGRVGWWTGFRRTLWLACVRPSKLAREMARPVDHSEARRFRAVVAVLSALPLLPPAILFPVFGSDGDQWDFPTLWRWAWAAMIVAGAAGWAWASTGAGLGLFHKGGLPDETADRAESLGHYACAPLALYPPLVAAGLAVAGAYLWSVGEWRPWRLADMTVGVPVTVRLPLALWATVTGAVLLRRTTGCGWAWTAAYAVLSTAVSFGLAAVYLFGWPHLSAFILLCLRGLAE
jgi:hypothetical protein